MLEQKERIIIWVAICISVAGIIVVVVLSTASRQFAEDIDVVHYREHEYHYEPPSSEAFTKSTVESVKTDIKPDVDYKPTLNDIIRAARTWQPAYTYWIGRKAPNFTLTDINGKKHRLSDYRGKNVMIIFWATWCGPCIAEVPHLITLRNLVSEDELAMLAISYRNIFQRETAKKVKDFAKQNRINYTVFSASESTMPAPFNRIVGYPSAFFIDKQGKIKLATGGLVSLNEIRAILQAE